MGSTCGRYMLNVHLGLYMGITGGIYMQDVDVGCIYVGCTCGSNKGELGVLVGGTCVRYIWDVRVGGICGRYKLELNVGCTCER